MHLKSQKRKNMSEEEILRIIENISEPRIKTYKGLGFKDHDESLISAYFAIQEISSHFFVPLQVIEICLRNSIHNSLTSLFEEKWPGNKWYDLAQLSDESKRTLLAAKKITIKKNGEDYTDDDLISNLMLGFWVYMLDKQHRNNKNPYHFWQYVVNDVFPGRQGKSVKNMFDDLKRINLTRNRLYHHEPIWKKRKREISFHEAINVLETEHSKAYEALGWLSQEKKGFMIQLGFYERFEECCRKHKE